MTNEKPGARFKRQINSAAGKLLDEWVGKERAAEAKGRVAAAFTAAAMSSKNPDDFYSCSPASVAHCVATAALTGIMPATGAAALAYLIPRRIKKVQVLTYQLSHRGLAALAARAGMLLIPVPVGVEDHLEVHKGQVTAHDQDPDDPPVTWEELRGVIVLVKEKATGTELYCGWVARKLIEQRRATSSGYTFAEKNSWAQGSDPWHAWPVEQAMKTAMHYAIGRGWCILDDTEAARALSSDDDTNGRELRVIDAETQEPAAAPASVRDFLQQQAAETARPELPDHGQQDVPDFEEENRKIAESREVIEAAPAEEPAPAKKKAAPKKKAARRAPADDGDPLAGLPT